jgi:hypothetical protein
MFLKVQAIKDMPAIIYNDEFAGELSKMDERKVTKEMLISPIELTIKQRIDFKTAQSLADKKAKERIADPMLLAWYDGNIGTHSPNISYGAQDKPSWLMYAQSRGGHVEITINNQEYVFVYKERSAYP